MIVTLNVLSSVSWHVFDVEGGRLAFRADISYGRGTLLVHHLHTGALTRLEALLIVGPRTGGHGSGNVAHWRGAADHLQVLCLANGMVEPVPVVVIILTTCLLLAFESSTGGRLFLWIQLLTISIITGLHGVVHWQVLVLGG